MVIAQAVYNWKVPIFPEASSQSELTDKKQFPNIVRVNAPLSKLGKGAAAVMKVDTCSSYRAQQKSTRYCTLTMMIVNIDKCQKYAIM